MAILRKKENVQVPFLPRKTTPTVTLERIKREKRIFPQTVKCIFTQKDRWMEDIVKQKKKKKKLR